VIWTVAYVASVVAVNVIFGIVPWLGSFIVGGIFILRDLSQREIGHRVLLASAIGIGISYLMANPAIATASAVAFGVSEVLDWIVFSRWRGSFRSRVIASSIAGAPVDSALFMLLAGFFAWPGFAVMTGSKLLALAVLPSRSAPTRNDSKENDR
jgi:queuosine precursor transporter